jgi:DHA1 family multidrug resistance protein-like MFS transporter
MMIFSGVCTIIVIIFLPETYAPVILLKKKNKLVKEDPVGSKNLYAEHEKQDWSIAGVIHRTVFRPFHMLALEPILILITIYLSVVYGLLFGRKRFIFSFLHVLYLTCMPVFEAFPIIFIEKRGFTIAQDGLIFIGVGAGATIGALISYCTSVHYPGLIKKWKGFPPPESRLFGAMIGSPVLVIGIFWLGWTGQYASIPWYVPALSTLFLGAGINLIFVSFLVRGRRLVNHSNLCSLVFSRVTSSIHICRFHWCIRFNGCISYFFCFRL